jgi:signal transduction histidine kinase
MADNKPYSVLIVEDERIVAMDLQQALQGMGYDAYAIASSADEAVSRASEKCPDLVLMDIRIKGQRDGIETALLLRERFGVPVVYLSAHADEATIERAKKTQSYGYLMKPIRMAELRSTIELSIYRHQLEKRAASRTRTPSELDLQRKRPLETDQQILADRLAALGTMAAGMAHQINNPLAVVIANAAYVLEELRRDPARFGEAIQAQSELEAAANRIATVIAEVQMFAWQSRVVAGHADVELAIAAAIRTSADSFRCAAKVIASAELIPHVKIGSDRLEQILVNLLINAAHATADAEATTTVEVRLHEDNVVIEVRDTGTGMLPQVRARAFEPFFTTKGVGAGSGLGLAVCHGIVTSIGGLIELESEVGRGTTVRLTVPAEKAIPLPARAAAPLQLGRILVIDDDRMVLNAIRRMLRGHEVMCIDDSRQVLALLSRGERFDLILSDLMMPHMSGMELYEQLLIAHPDVAKAMVFMTGGIVDVKATDFMTIVPNTCLRKPLLGDGLQTLVQERLRETVM